MLLQPMVENAIKHGLAPRLEKAAKFVCERTAENGRLVIRNRRQRYGNMGRTPAQKCMQGGIGISNVHERLRLLYGDQFKMDIRSQEGEGTQIHIEIPELATANALSR